MSPVSDVDELYGLPLEDFTRERDALAKELRSGGDRSAADEVKRLTKPNRAAWAVNQLMRSQPRARRSLAEAAEAASRATSRLGDPDAADELRLASTAGRRAVSELMSAGRGLVSADGKALSEATLQHVADTLLAALADPEVREQVEAARLTRELHATGFPLGAGAAIAPGAKKPASKAKPKAPAKATKAPKRDTAKEKRARAKEEREAKQAKAAQAALKKAQAELTRAEREITRARTKAEAAVEGLQEAEATRDRAAKALQRAEKDARG